MNGSIGRWTFTVNVSRTFSYSMINDNQIASTQRTVAKLHSYLLQSHSNKAIQTVTMKITVKVLQGQECTLETLEDTNVLDLKKMVAENLNVLPDNQKLLYMGKPLSDSKSLKEYLIKDGAKINLVIKKADDSNTVANKELNSLQEAVSKFLRKYYNEADSKKVLNEFMKEFDRSLASLSLDDIERMSAACLIDDKQIV